MAVHYEIEGPVAVITLDRPDVRNAVDWPTADALTDAVRALRDGRRARGRGAHRRRRYVLRGRRPEGDDRGWTPAQPCRGGRRRADGPDVSAAHQAGDRRGGRACGRRWPRARDLVRSPRRRRGCDLRGVLPAMGRAVDRRRHRPPPAAHRPEPRPRPRADRSCGRRRRGARHGAGQPGGAVGHRAAAAVALATEVAVLPQRCLRSDRVSLYAQWDRSVDDALAIETTYGIDVLRSVEALEGAARFTGGSGRHGASS